jgi:hypothetical protein
MSKPFSRRSAKGAELLDEKSPGWAREVDIDRLDMGSPAGHVLAQLYESYVAGLTAVGLPVQTVISPGSPGYSTAARHGFCNVAGTDALTEAWKDRIRERLSVAA